MAEKEEKEKEEKEKLRTTHFGLLVELSENRASPGSTTGCDFGIRPVLIEIVGWKRKLKLGRITTIFISTVL